jgi:hypothetical protein
MDVSAIPTESSLGYGRQRTPAPLSGVPINSMPASSKAFVSFLKVSIFPEGTLFPQDSRRTSVEKATFERSAKPLTVSPVIALAALIWLLVIKI